MPNTTIKAKTVDLGELDLGDRLYVVLELEVMDEGRRRNGKAGTVDYRGAVIKDVLRLAGALPTELADELRRQRREAETEATGIPVVPGLEGFLDSGGVVITEADRGITAAELERDELEAVARWVDLGVTVHALRAALVDPDQDGATQGRLDALWAELNEVVDGDVAAVTPDEVTVIIDIEGEERVAIDLPDYEPTDDDELDLDAGEPFDGYDNLDFDGIITHVADYVAADRALGGPSAKARSYIQAILDYEVANGGRPNVVAALADTVTIITEELEDLEPGELAEPWDGYAKASADSIIAHLRGVAETDVDQARELIAAVDAYELAHKARKAVLNRIGGLVAPPLPDAPDDDLELDDDTDDELDLRLDELDDDDTDDELEEDL